MLGRRPRAVTRGSAVMSVSGAADRTRRRSESGTGISRATGTPRLVTVNDSPASTARMIAALSLRSSRWLIVLTDRNVALRST